MNSNAKQLTAQDQAIPRHLQVSRAIRDQILRGRFDSGSALPTIYELAEQFKTSVYTVQTALTPLEKDGLIERKRRVGTIVKHHSEVMTTVAVFGTNALAGPIEDGFYRELNRQLQEQLLGAKIRTKTFLDPRDLEDRHAPYLPLKRAVEANEVQGLFVIKSDGPSLSWLNELPIATSYCGDTKAPNRVGSSNFQMLRLGLERLHAQGCRRVGLVCNRKTPPDGLWPSTDREFYRSFFDLLCDIGLTTRHAWMAIPEECPQELEAFGYESMHRIWSGGSAGGRPDGVFVFPDVSARGVMTAVMELGVRVPEELKLVFHRNSGVKWPCPLAVDWTVIDTQRWAAEMIKQVRVQKAGLLVEPVCLEFELQCAANTVGVPGS